jgi:hypothetical protein
MQQLFFRYNRGYGYVHNGLRAKDTCGTLDMLFKERVGDVKYSVSEWFSLIIGGWCVHLENISLIPDLFLLIYLSNLRKNNKNSSFSPFRSTVTVENRKNCEGVRPHHRRGCESNGSILRKVDTQATWHA